VNFNFNDYLKKKIRKMILSCQNCYQNFQLDSNSLSYLNPDFSLAGICTSCYHEIDSKLKLLVDVSKLKLIKKKALKIKELMS
tara:strand:+ start:301 stop:549 length:249 start_codon:yes stop_codon:yes gene_type:complete